MTKRMIEVFATPPCRFLVNAGHWRDAYREIAGQRLSTTGSAAFGGGRNLTVHPSRQQQFLLRGLYYGVPSLVMPCWDGHDNARRSCGNRAWKRSLDRLHRWNPRPGRRFIRHDPCALLDDRAMRAPAQKAARHAGGGATRAAEAILGTTACCETRRSTIARRGRMRDKLFIDGAWTAPVGGGVRGDRSRQRSRGAQGAGRHGRDIDRAVAAATPSIGESVATCMSGAARCGRSCAISAVILERKPGLAAPGVMDNGKPLPEGVMGHRRRRRLFQLLRRPHERMDQNPEEAIPLPNLAFPPGSSTNR